METILEDPFGEIDHFPKMGFPGNDSDKGVLVDTKLKQKTEKKCRIEKRTSKLAMSGKGSEGTSQVNKVVPQKRNNRMKRFEQIHMKLQFLEEESKLMKKAILECAEDRAVLMRKITQQLGIVQERLEGQEDGENSLEVPSTVNLHRLLECLQIQATDTSPTLGLALPKGAR